MWINIDIDKSGSIIYEELNTEHARLGFKVTVTEVKQLMETVCFLNLSIVIEVIESGLQEHHLVQQ